MARRVTLAAALVCGALTPALAQVCGDVNADDKITTSDAQRVLKAAVGQPVELVCTDQCAQLETRLAALEALLAHVTTNGDNLVLTGMNFQVVSGAGVTDGVINGTGNIIIGYDESNTSSDKKTGSHNLVIGMDHSYSTYGGIVAGEDNEITGDSASVLGGTGNSTDGTGAVVVGGRNNKADGESSVVLAGENNETTADIASVLGGADNSTDGDGAVVVGGENNQADGQSSVVLAGENNRTVGRSCSISAGTHNVCSGGAAAVSGGTLNICSGASSAIGGGGQRTLGSPGAWLAGTLGPVF